MVVAWLGCCGFFLARSVKQVVQLPAVLCCEAMVWSISFLAFPIRMLSAVDRELKLGRLIAEMQEQMDGLVWENKDLEERLQAALKEQDAMEAVLDEMEEEQEDAFARIQVLESQLKALRQENMRLNEHKGKTRWDSKQATTKAEEDDAPRLHHHHGNNSNKDGNELWWEDAGKGEDKLSPDPSSYQQQLALTSSVEDGQQVANKAVARRRSLFSLGMSLAVGAVAWSADAPCLPLLAGLFAAVGVSMRSVSRCCFSDRHRRGWGDAVALLSLNWFLLGVLTSPMLPGVARALVPRAGHALGPALTWFAATAPL